MYPTYYGSSLHSEWSFNISKNYDESNTYEWSEPNRPDANVTRCGAGENGTAFVPSADLKLLMDQLLEQENYNLLASDMISLHRSLPDLRYDECKILSYPEKLPNTSIVIIFHNEAWTPLLRTVWSIIERSPPELINEIILIDDASTTSDLKRPLEDYIEQLPIRIKLIRTSKREGLIRARLIGAKYASGNILTFLDAHIECNEGWLQPLLARIANDRSVIAVPRMDSVSSKDVKYGSSKIRIHGFRWSLIFDWMHVPDRERIHTHHDNAARRLWLDVPFPLICTSGFLKNARINLVRCPDCRVKFCFECKKVWESQHLNITCEQFANWQRDNNSQVSQDAIGNYLQKNCIDCPKCKFKYDLSRGGCIHFTCTQCKHEFCFGCSRPFLRQCTVSQYCKSVGLHAHHKRNCFYYLRDKTVADLQGLLQANGTKLAIEVPYHMTGNKIGDATNCPIELQVEQGHSLVDTTCTEPTEGGQAGLCKKHYKEFLILTITKANLETTSILTVNNYHELLRFQGIAIPPRTINQNDDEYKNDCQILVINNIPLK